MYFQISIYTWVVMKLTSHAGEFVCLFPCLLLVFAGERYFKKHAAKQGTFSMGVMEHNGITLANIDILDNYGEEPRNYL